MSLNEITDATFAQEVLASSTPVLVDFTAEWCGPCRMITPVLEQIAGEQQGRLKIVSLDVDVNPETVRTYSVMAMPTMALFVNGELVERIVGARPKRQLLDILEPRLAGAVA